MLFPCQVSHSPSTQALTDAQGEELAQGQNREPLPAGWNSKEGSWASGEIWVPLGQFAVPGVLQPWLCIALGR